MYCTLKIMKTLTNMNPMNPGDLLYLVHAHIYYTCF
jgi:hypothetical protein